MSGSQSNHSIHIGGYTAERRGNHYTILGRGIPIGYLHLREGQWVASRCTLDRTRPQLEIADANPHDAMRVFLHNEGWVRPGGTGGFTGSGRAS